MKQEKLKEYASTLLDSQGSFSFDDAVQMFFIETVLSNFQPGQELESPLSRHAILHGSDTNYGNELNSLRCILFIDYLIDKIVEIREEKVELE